jgi:hypothetical protein
VNGREFNTSLFTQVYYHPDPALGEDQAQYGESIWIDRLMKIVDTAKNNGAGFVVLNTWWSKLDGSQVRPDNLSDNLNFEPLDRFMDYAHEKGLYVMLYPEMHHNIPQWWLDENNFPASWYDRDDIPEDERCTCCETDSMGTSYQNPSDACDLAQEEFGQFLKIVIDRYKNHPATIGWVFGVGPTAEDNFGPSYPILWGVGGVTGEPVPDQKGRFTDFSLVFTNRFRDYLQTKYSDNAGLQAAWNDPSVSLSAFTMPSPSKFFDLYSPDEEFNCGAEGITTVGTDFCQFRDDLRDDLRHYYVDIFKQNDPNHILVLNGIDLKPPVLEWDDIDGVIWHPNFNWTRVPWQEHDQYLYNLKRVNAVQSSGKLPMPSAETLPVDATGLSQDEAERLNEQRMNYMRGMGEGIICTGSLFGYNSDLFSENGIRTIPTWYTPAEMDAAQEIGSYTPTANCGCETVNTVYEQNECASAPQSEAECSLILGAYDMLCGSSSSVGCEAACEQAHTCVPGLDLEGCMDVCSGWSDACRTCIAALPCGQPGGCDVACPENAGGS